MVKSPFILAMMVSISLAHCVYGDEITNITQCMNTSLTSNVLERFPTNATSTVQSCVLSFVKGVVIGDLKTFSSPFSEQIRASEFGFSDLDDIPASVSDEFSALMSSVSNCTNKVISYDETTNNELIRVNITLQRQSANYNRAEVSHLDITQTSNGWYIVNWDVDE